MRIDDEDATTTPADLLRHAAEMIKHHGWTQGRMVSHSGAHCMVGALSFAYTSRRPNAHSAGAYITAEGFLREVLKENYSDDTITYINDRVMSKASEPIAMLEKAAVRAEETVQ